MFGYHVTGSTGTLFLYGIVVGALGLLGPSLLLAGARRTSRRALAYRQVQPSLCSWRWGVGKTAVTRYTPNALSQVQERLFQAG